MNHKLTDIELIALLRTAAEHETKVCPQYKDETLFWLAAERLQALLEEVTLAKVTSAKVISAKVISAIEKLSQISTNKDEPNG